MVSADPAPWSDVDPDNRGALAIDRVAPRYHVRPTTTEQMAEVIRGADRLGLKVAPRGGGTRMALGNPPSQLDLVVDTGGLGRVIEYEPADLTVTVEAGMRFADLQELLRPQGQFLALDPPAQAGSTIGGVIATNASGPLRFAYGTARDLVIGTRVVNADGRISKAGGRVVKNVAGYDLNKLYIGSLGTVGIIVELSFKLAPIPPTNEVVVGTFADAEAARGMIAAAIHSPLSPMAIELASPKTADAASLGPRWSVLISVGGYQEAVARQVRDFTAMIAEHRGEPNAGGAETWAAYEAVIGSADPRVVVKASAPISQAVTLVELLERSLAGLQPRVWSHAGDGVAYAAFDPGDDLDATRRTLTEVRQSVRGLGSNASLVVERCPIPLKQGFDVWGDPGDGVALMRALKQRLDPRATLNPGRYVAGI